MLLIALALKIESPGPVIFRQMRAGFNGSVFEIWKFRSMYTSQTDQEARRQTSKDDPRVTPVGRFIRATSFDELPQFFNVLQGTMSVVGPRPHALKTSTGGKLLEEVVDKYAFRHRVKPGLTGWAQVNGLRGELDSADKLKRRVTFDLQYIDNWSLGFDLKIVLRTVLKLFYDPSAY
jgi:polysaccharide biosynthesis protein PslA